MGSHSRPRAIWAGLLCLCGATAVLRGEGSPPTITDDPGTPGHGRWEINLGFGIERRPGQRNWELPAAELLYGAGEAVQLGYALPWLGQSQDGQAHATGLGKSTGGIKWRFFENDGGGLSLSVHPQLEFNTPGSDSAQRGLVDSGSVFLLPLQLEKSLGPVMLILEIGREFNDSVDTWFYGSAFSHRLNSNCALAVELAGAATPMLSRSRLIVNLAFVVDVSEHSSLLLSLGREVHNHEDPPAMLIRYAGWQLRL